MGPRVLLHALRHCVVYEIILANFKLAVSTSNAKPPNLIPSQIFRLYANAFYMYSAMPHRNTSSGLYFQTFISIISPCHTYIPRCSSPLSVMEIPDTSIASTCKRPCGSVGRRL